MIIVFGQDGLDNHFTSNGFRSNMGYVGHAFRFVFYKLVQATTGNVVPTVGGKMFTPEEASKLNEELHKMGMGLAWIEKSRIKNNMVVEPPERQ
jgi:hypothetical protein